MNQAGQFFSYGEFNFKHTFLHGIACIISQRVRDEISNLIPTKFLEISTRRYFEFVLSGVERKKLCFTQPRKTIQKVPSDEKQHFQDNIQHCRCHNSHLQRSVTFASSHSEDKENKVTMLAFSSQYLCEQNSLFLSFAGLCSGRPVRAKGRPEVSNLCEWGSLNNCRPRNC